MRKLTEDEKQHIINLLDEYELCPHDIGMPDYYIDGKCTEDNSRCRVCTRHALNFLRIAETEDE